MIVKPPSTDPRPTDPRLRAGIQAERQMAYYLHRAFATSSNLYVINDLRLVDPEQPEPDPRTGGSSPGVAQIDHLVLHRFGAFIVESKSVTGTVTVRDDGGGDEWTRSGKGMPSPLRQAERQGEFLRAF
ncbi:MAG: nuclease-related domain-containing protein, partial [Pseudomonadota bacterium]